jgi:hypothetical protein
MLGMLRELRAKCATLSTFFVNIFGRAVAIQTLSTGQKLAKFEEKGFHENYYIQNMKPYATGYSTSPNLAASPGVARHKSAFSGTISNCPVSRQNSQLQRISNGFPLASARVTNSSMSEKSSKPRSSSALCKLGNIKHCVVLDGYGGTGSLWQPCGLKMASCWWSSLPQSRSGQSSAMLLVGPLKPSLASSKPEASVWNRLT